jgi:hypothetical protein
MRPPRNNNIRTVPNLTSAHEQDLRIFDAVYIVKYIDYVSRSDERDICWRSQGAAQRVPSVVDVLGEAEPNGTAIVPRIQRSPQSQVVRRPGFDGIH